MFTGIYKYVPVEFTFSLASVLHTWVHWTLTDVKFTNTTIFDSYCEYKIFKVPRSEDEKLHRDQNEELTFDSFSIDNLK